jgi:tRNA nucleotidyltransferase (CCA-adding enzyme)
VRTACDGVPAAVVVLAAAVTTRPGVRDALIEYLRRWRGMRAEISGDDLIAAGIAPGPAIAAGLRAAVRARVDGRAPDREKQLAVALRAARRHLRRVLRRA